MELKFENLAKFIKEFYLRILNIDTSVSYKDNIINISGGNDIFFGISIGENFSIDRNYDSNQIKGFKDLTVNLLHFLNKNVSIPLAFKLKKKVFSLKEKSVFILGNNFEIGNISENNLTLLKYSSILYTNNKESLVNLLDNLNINNKIIFAFSDIFVQDFSNVSEIVLFQYGDYFESDKEINKVCDFLRNNFDRLYIQPYYSNFINKYSLAHTNYGSLSYLGSYDDISLKENYLEIKDKIAKFIKNTDNFISIFGFGEMICLAGLSIEFKSLSSMEIFIENTKDILNNNYLIEIIFETENGYFNFVNHIKDIKYSDLKGKINTSYITLFIYNKSSDFFVGYSKYNSYNNQKSFTFLSAPLCNISEFTKNSILQINKSKYLFGETVDYLNRFLDSLNIISYDKELFYGDDIIKIHEFPNKEIETNSKINLVKKAFPYLIDLLDNSQKIHYLSDGGASCILDPGDNIKKYINLYYNEYSVIGIKGPNVISTVILGTGFVYKYIYWAPLIYTITPKLNYLLKTDFFSEGNFKDTLIIFYSFGKNIKNDFIVFRQIFAKNINIQIIGDIGAGREYNKVFDTLNLNKTEIIYIINNIDNIVYLISY